MIKENLTRLTLKDDERKQLRDALHLVKDIAEQSGLMRDEHQHQFDLVEDLIESLYN